MKKKKLRKLVPFAYETKVLPFNNENFSSIVDIQLDRGDITNTQLVMIMVGAKIFWIGPAAILKRGLSFKQIIPIPPGYDIRFCISDSEKPYTLQEYEIYVTLAYLKQKG